MMTLCGNHHAQATSGALSVTDQREFKANPYNMKIGQPGGLLQFGSTEAAPSILIGHGLRISGEGCVLSVDGEGLLELRRAEQGRLSLSVLLFDEDDGLVASIIDNEWWVGDDAPWDAGGPPWDLEFNDRVLTIRHESRHIGLRLDTHGDEPIVTGELWRRRYKLDLNDDGVIARVPGSDRPTGIGHLTLDGLGLELLGGRMVVDAPLDRHVQSLGPADPPQVGRNDPCPCNSGRKWKHCHGR
jgi:hypothetical protein